VVFFNMVTADREGEGKFFHGCVYLNLSITFSDVFGSAFDFGDVFWNIFFFGDVWGLLKKSAILS
jgi:hypothetical protein